MPEGSLFSVGFLFKYGSLNFRGLLLNVGSLLSVGFLKENGSLEVFGFL